MDHEVVEYLLDVCELIEDIQAQQSEMRPVAISVLNALKSFDPSFESRFSNTIQGSRPAL